MIARQLFNVWGLLASTFISFFVVGCSPQPNTLSSGEPPEQKQATYVGGQQCSNCHQQEWNLWENSHHDLSLQAAGPDSVLGNFSNTTFRYN